MMDLLIRVSDRFVVRFASPPPDAKSECRRRPSATWLKVVLNLRIGSKEYQLRLEVNASARTKHHRADSQRKVRRLEHIFAFDSNPVI